MRKNKPTNKSTNKTKTKTKKTEYLIKSNKSPQNVHFIKRSDRSHQSHKRHKNATKKKKNEPSRAERQHSRVVRRPDTTRVDTRHRGKCLNVSRRDPSFEWLVGHERQVQVVQRAPQCFRQLRVSLHMYVI